MALWPTLGDNLKFAKLIKFLTFLNGGRVGNPGVFLCVALWQPRIIINERWGRSHEVVRILNRS